MLQLARRSANVTHRLRSAEEWRNLFASALPDALFGCLAGADEEVALSVMHALEHMVAGPAEELAVARSVVDAPRAADALVAAMNGHPAEARPAGAAPAGVRGPRGRGPRAGCNATNHEYDL